MPEKPIDQIEASTDQGEGELSVPKWPHYSDPSAQKEQIEKELA